MSNIAVIILAAGESRRFGEAKQLRQLDGKTLLARAIDAGLDSNCRNVFVVLGARFEQLKNSIQEIKQIEVIRNATWTDGMGSSIGLAVKHVQSKLLDLDAVIICTCDQPFLSKDVINNLIAKFENEKCKLVASRYNELNSVPALFANNLFHELAELRGKEGARNIVRRHENESCYIEFPEGSIDIDTEEDWQEFLKLHGRSPLDKQLSI